MSNIVNECYEFMKDCGLAYAFCGGYALDLFTNQKNRPHSDIDITLFNNDKKDVIDYILKKGWNVYYHKPSTNCLKMITDSNHDEIANCLCIWAIKPKCSLVKIKSKPDEENLFTFEIVDDEQKDFDFIEIIFNLQKDGLFICSDENNIGRELDKAILYSNSMPFLAPEVILYFISDPAYIESDYHRAKNDIDFDSVPPFLSNEGIEWLISAIEMTYPNGNHRLAYLKHLQHTL